MDKKYILIAGVVVFAFVVGIVLGRMVFTGSVIQDVSNSGNYTWTKALCDKDRNCLDAVITCSNGKVAGIEPITTVVPHPEGWTDFRNNTEEFCK